MTHMADYMLQQHIEKVCMPNLNNDDILYCGTCPFEEDIVEEYPELALHFKMKRRLIQESHNDKLKIRK